MAFVNDIRGHEATLMSRMTDTFRSLADAYEHRRMFDRTVRELSTLSPRELEDLGLSRGDIRPAAYAAVFGK